MPSLSMLASGTPFADHIGFDATTGELVLSIPAGADRYIPARACKALVKMAVELLRAVELPCFSKVIAWLRGPEEDLLPDMVVGLSIASLRNAPPLLSAALLRRVDDRTDRPSTVFVTSMGLICLQILLWSDADDGVWPARMRARPDINWRSIVGAPGHGDILFDYGRPTTSTGVDQA